MFCLLPFGHCPSHIFWAFALTFLLGIALTFSYCLFCLLPLRHCPSHIFWALPKSSFSYRKNMRLCLYIFVWWLDCELGVNKTCVMVKVNVVRKKLNKAWFRTRTNKIRKIYITPYFPLVKGTIWHLEFSLLLVQCRCLIGNLLRKQSLLKQNQFQTGFYWASEAGVHTSKRIHMHQFQVFMNAQARELWGGQAHFKQRSTVNSLRLVSVDARARGIWWKMHIPNKDSQGIV